MSRQTDLLPTLDHIVILVSHDTLLGLSERLRDIFIVAPGGTHADGLTSNKLVFFQDGVYIEFIAFHDNIDHERRKKHRWGTLKEGSIIDWAFTYPPGRDFSPTKQRVLNADTGFLYGEPAFGGRKREDGTILEWKISAPTDALGSPISPGWLPFWCLDKTPRELRVPYEVEPALTQHPSGVHGVASLSLFVPEKDLSNLGKTYASIYDETPTISDDQGWEYEVPSGSATGRHIISLLRYEESPEVTIKLALEGPKCGKVEILPGLEIDIE
ncbi:uncharacterized protein N7479_005667 [Penicillium vulpinum]|uniref:Glyoxalase-like domain-containing protein n=1 Tax=Penicillium vulpinum TaxID=29845 RepID=A0A1V6SEZ7_9EURO|nr:uncharacterized protein N7479_005667 [Penicillium vulpinum]KAJ5958517.1 hypothetical protein N7479_005667 [Penicillium vulpinum]OQE12571.1 hypothetical protein PENVUL_c001G03070 [Penicillium vulpinum]